jgi:two-component system NarL family sensor kinase
MPLSFRMMLIAIIQVILTAIFTYTFVTDEYRTLSQQNLATLEKFLIEQKQQELRNYTSLGLAAIDNETHNSLTQKQADTLVVELTQKLLYGEDGYFFVYDNKGNNIALPKDLERQGENFWDFENSKGEKTIQILTNNAINGGGFHRYEWLQPSTNTTTEKLSYSLYHDDWKWMLGTGVYLDSVNQQLENVKGQIDKHVNRTKRIILFIALSSIFAIFMFGLVVSLSQKKQSDDKITELGQRVIIAQEEQSRHISRELHDGIVQILISVKYALEATGLSINRSKIDKPKPLVDAEHNLETAITEIRRISHHLHPRILDELGLSDAIEALSVEFSERTGIAVVVHKMTLRKLLPDDISTTLYRVVQESLINIDKHAQAHHVEIHLSMVDNWLTLGVKDDGIGFDTQAVQGNKDAGIGLRNLAERVEYHLGLFMIKSKPGKGSSIIAKIPRSAFANHFNRNENSHDANTDKLS